VSRGDEQAFEKIADGTKTAPSLRRDLEWTPWRHSLPRMTDSEDYPLTSANWRERSAYRSNSFTGMRPNLAQFVCACRTPTVNVPQSLTAAGHCASHGAHDLLHSDRVEARHVSRWSRMWPLVPERVEQKSVQPNHRIR
jgi:hypothetical protein